MKEGKKGSDSRAQQVEIVMPRHVNASYRLFGGQLMEWIDVVAGVVARRHSGREVITAAVEHLEFLAPASINDIVVLQGRVTYVGRTSMEVCVETFVENSGGERKMVNCAYLTMVALDERGKPTEVPTLICETEAEKADFEAGKARRAARKG